MKLSIGKRLNYFVIPSLLIRFELPIMASLGLLWLLTAPAHASSAPVVVANEAVSAPASTPIAIGYELGWRLSVPKYRVVVLDKDIEGLASTPAADQKALLERLARLAELTRRSELSALQAAVAQLKELDAPPSCYSDATAAIETLKSPLDTQATSDVSKEKDPQALKIMATLDEADSALPRSWTRIMIWLKLAHSPEALWGFHLGEVSASLQAAVTRAPEIAALDQVAGLRKARPADCPKPVKDALDALYRKMMQAEVNQDSEQEASVAIQQTYPMPSY